MGAQVEAARSDEVHEMVGAPILARDS